MTKQLILSLICCMAALLLQAQRVNRLFDSSWKFIKGDVPNGEKMDLSDATWRTVDLPHDWSIEDLPNQSDSIIGPFSKNSIGTTATGYTVGGTGWYRKHFTLNDIDNKQVSVYFDGVYMNSDIWINEHHLGSQAYGYSPFYFDLTPFLKRGGDNVIAVRVRNEGKNSRWYSGSGIYRHVWLTITEPVHVENWGVFITTPEVSPASATINIKTTILNAQDISSLRLVIQIRDAENKVVATRETQLTPGSNNEISQDLHISKPSLWSPESPYLHQAITEIKRGNKVLDHVTTTFGIRSIEINAEKGFLLNGQSILLRGGAMHHDNGPLGSVAIDRAEERRVELLKKYGYNAVRTAHNPPSQEFLDACDRLGIIVIDEAFDQWQRSKNEQDYHMYFDSDWKKDLHAIVLRDRNHPSVVFWSVGNELNERVDSSGLVVEKMLIDEVKRLDTTRPVTEAICSFWDHPKYKWDTTAAAFAMMDVGSYNYMWKEYEGDHEKHPQRIMMGTESYPKEALINWNLVEKHPYVIGDFVWTAMDYMGETGLGHTRLDNERSPFLQRFPWFNAWCGDIDLTGGKKPQLYYRDIVWRTSKMNMLVHTPIPEGRKEIVSDWGWPDEVPYYHFPGSEGKSVRVNVYTRYPQVRLELNGKTIDQQSVSPENLTATFEFIYQPGTLKAIAIDNGKEVDSVELRTAGSPAKIRLTADRNQIKANRNDLCYVTAEVVDAEGHLVPDSVIPLHFSLSGNGEIAATANASPSDMQSFQQPSHKTYRGKCLVIIRPTEKKGKLILKVEGGNLPGDEIVIEAR